MSQKHISSIALMHTLRPAAQAALLACLSAGAWAQSPAALPAGTLEFVQGAVSVRGAAGASRIGQRGTVVNNGETIETQSGRAQMRMVDGAFISLQNDTSLRLDNYRVASATEAESGLMSLVRGGLRTVTGLIGRSNKQNYRLQTTTATIGIRGTGFSATSGDEGTRVRVSEGAIALCTQGGCLDLAAQQTGFAPNTNTLPIRIAAAPVLQPTQAPSDILIAPQTGLRDFVIDTEPQVVPATIIPLPSGPGGMLVAYSTNSFNAGVIGGTLGFDSAGRLLTYTDCCGPTGYNTVAANVAEFNADGIVAWGRWTAGNYSIYSNNVPLNHFNYVAGISGAAVPISGTYSVFGSTAPVAIDGATGVVSAVGASNSVTGNMTINFPGATASQYATTNFLGTSSTIGSTGGACANVCAGVVPYGYAIQGSVFGSGNTRVGAQYGFTSGIGTVTGAVVLRPVGSGAGS
jgi:hypothetical protein